MIECPDCGAQNADNSTFCIRCGTQFSAPTGLGPLETPRQVDPSRLVDEAAELYAANQLDDAAEACHAALDIDSELVSARALLGMIEEDRGNHAAALAEYEAVIRLAPERTAEREKADRMRALVRREAGPAIPEEENRLRRYMPALIAVGAALVVLIVGGLIMSAGGRDRASDTAAQTGGQPGGFLLEETSPQVGQPAATGEGVESLQTGGGVIPTTPIGATIQDQTAQQRPNAYQQGSSHNGGGGRPRTASVEPIPLPPPTVESKTPGTGPLTIPAPETNVTTAPAPSAIGPPISNAPEPLPEDSRGKVRIWVGDDAPASTHGNQGGGQDSTQGQGYTVPSLSQRERIWSGQSRSGATVTSRSGGSADGSGGNGPRPAPTTQSSSGGGSTAGRLIARAGGVGNGGGTSGPQYQPRAGQGGGNTGAVMPTQRAGTNGAQAQPRNYHGPSTSAATRQPAQTRSAPAATSTSAQVHRMAGGASSGQGRTSPGSESVGSSASALRAQAQRAQASGNSQQARALYKAAMDSYAREAASNPARAASSRSAIDSCQRSLDALDASQ